MVSKDEDLDRLREDIADLKIAREFEAQRQEDRWMRWVGYPTRPLVYFIVLALLYYNFPSISDRPVGSLTVNEVVGAIGSVCFVVVWFYAFFNYSGNDINWELWGSFGLLLVGGAVLLWMFA